MGLDSYLEKFPRYKDATAKDIRAIEGYFSLLRHKAEKGKYANDTLKEWCGIDASELPPRDYIDFYRQHYIGHFSEWDTNLTLPRWSIFKQVAYWRKANQVHNWMVENVQEGVDDCGYYEVSKEDLEDLLDICKKIKAEVKMVKGKVENGREYKDGEWKAVYEDGWYIENPWLCEQLLPSTAGFFFGSTNYDQWYMRDIYDTIEALMSVLANTDFEKEIVCYTSSW